jgi:Mrp family chromosome partitioning ATPase
VGKTCITGGIAWALSRYGRVGVTDLDVRGPDITYLLGILGEAETDPGFNMWVPARAPLDGHEVTAFSPRMWFGDGTGIMATDTQVQGFVREMLFRVDWNKFGPISRMVIDMDPSSGASLEAISSMMSDVRAVVVTTSDRTSIEDCTRFVDSCRAKGVRLAGVIGNKVGPVCPSCHAALRCDSCHAEIHYGDGDRIRAFANEMKVPHLGSLPWSPEFQTDPIRAMTGIGRDLFTHVAEVLR